MTQVVLTSVVKSPTSYYAFEPTRNPENGMSPITRWWSRAFAFGDQSASVVSVAIPPGARVLSVVLEISVAWTGTTAVTVGDGTAADGWIATAIITPTTAGDFGRDLTSTYGAKGKLYQDGDTIDVSFAGIASAGEAILFVEMISYAEAIAIEDTT